MSETRDEMPVMQAYTRKPEPVRAVQWHKPGDHPDDFEYCGSWCVDVSLGIPSELEPGCWIVDGEHHGREVFDDALFRDCFAPAALPSRDDLGRAAYEAFTCDPERIERFGVMPSWDVLESVRQDFWCRVGEAVAAVVNPGSEVARG